MLNIKSTRDEISKEFKRTKIDDANMLYRTRTDILNHVIGRKLLNQKIYLFLGGFLCLTVLLIPVGVILIIFGVRLKNKCKKFAVLTDEVYQEYLDRLK